MLMGGKDGRVIRKLTHKTEDVSAMENELLENLYCQKTA
jgi:hypothetical protein